jgi:hypothetical protein
MTRVFNHRATSSSKSGGPTSNASVGNNESAPSTQQTERKKRSVTESGERLVGDEMPTITPEGT